MLANKLLLFLVCLVSPALAQTLPGYDVLAVARYCNTFLQAPKLPAMSTLLDTFGDPLPCVERRINLGGLQSVQIDLIDATCWRNNRCEPGHPKPDNLNAIKRRAKVVNKLAIKYPAVDFWVSSGLEHDVQHEATVKKMLDTAKAGCPACRGVINSPYSGAKIPGYPLELHGTNVTAFSISADGKSVFDADTLDGDGNNFNFRTSGQYTTFAWSPEFNGRVTGEEDVPPPNKRTCWPTADIMTQAYLVMQPQQPRPMAPPQCKFIYTVKVPEIYKPNAEAYAPCPNPDKRGNRPLLLIKKRGKRGEKLNVLDRHGTVTGCFSYYGPLAASSLHRWYMGTCSKQTPTDLYRDLKGEWGFVKLSKDRCLLINSVRRLGSYR